MYIHIYVYTHIHDLKVSKFHLQSLPCMLEPDYVSYALNFSLN